MHHQLTLEQYVSCLTRAADQDYYSIYSIGKKKQQVNINGANYASQSKSVHSSKLTLWCSSGCEKIIWDDPCQEDLLHLRPYQHKSL